MTLPASLNYATSNARVCPRLLLLCGKQLVRSPPELHHMRGPPLSRGLWRLNSELCEYGTPQCSTKRRAQCDLSPCWPACARSSSEISESIGTHHRPRSQASQPGQARQGQQHRGQARVISCELEWAGQAGQQVLREIAAIFRHIQIQRGAIVFLYEYSYARVPVRVHVESSLSLYSYSTRSWLSCA